MPNPILTRYQGQRAELIAKATGLAAEAATAERSLTDAEETIIRDTNSQVDELAAKIKPLEELLTREAANAETQRLMDGLDADELTRGDTDTDTFLKRFESPGEFIAERSVAIDSGDATLIRQFERAMAHEKVASVPGLIPKPIVGPLINWLDASRPVTDAFTLRPLPAKGSTFDRPRVTQRTQAGEQAAEKTEFVSRELQVNSLTAQKKTIGSTLNLSRQVIDWSSPSVLDLVISDMIDQVAIQGEAIVTTESVTQAAKQKQAFDVMGATVKPAALLAALAQSAIKVHAGTTRLPDRVIVSIDVWAALKGISYAGDGRSMLEPANAKGVNNLGTSAGVGAFTSTLDGLPVTVAPAAPPLTFIVADSRSLEVYEDRDQLLRVDEPKIAGLEVAVFTYMAALTIEPKGLVGLAKGTV